MSQGVVDSVLSTEEREWAFALEEALFGKTEEADNSRNMRRGARRAFRRNRQTANSSDPIKYKDMPTDFELATHAIIAKGNDARALKRIRRLSIFKEAYRVPSFETDDGYDTENAIESVLLCIKKFLLAYPDFVKVVGMDKHGRVTVVVRLRGLRWSHPPPFNYTEPDRMRAMYCLLNALQPTLESVRRGTVWIADLGGVKDMPLATFLEGCRKLLRDSFPIRVQDVPVVRCPPVWSGAFVGTYPFWSRHFGKKFVRVDTETLRNHFPAYLLSTNRSNSGKSSHQITSSMPLHRKNKKLSKTNPPKKKVVVAPNGDIYDNDWENLDEGDYSEDTQKKGDLLSGSHSEWGDFSDMNGNLGGTEAVIEIDEELWTKIERLVRMRFETERNFRVA